MEYMYNRDQNLWGTGLVDRNGEANNLCSSSNLAVVEHLLDGVGWIHVSTPLRFVGFTLHGCIKVPEAMVSTVWQAQQQSVARRGIVS